MDLVRERDVTVQRETTASNTPKNLYPEGTRIPLLRPPLCKPALDIPTEVSDLMYLTARQDLEFKSSLAVARHYIENLLAAFSHAVAARDEDSLATIIHKTRISVEGAVRASTGLDVRQVIDWLAPWNRNVLLTTAGLSVHFSGSSVHYAAVYQIWDTGTATNSSPVCTSMGTLHGCLAAGPQVWTWTDHTMRHLQGRASESTV